jgi:hypothetical protein
VINYSIRTNTAAVALLFTDADGQILFADNHFAKLVEYDDARSLIGQPLDQVMGIERYLVSHFLQNLKEIGYVHNWTLELRTRLGVPILTHCAAVATYDEREIFIGADLALALYDDYRPIEITLTNHKDALNTRIRQMQAEAPDSRTLLELYTAVQISALQVLLARMAGPRISKAQDAKISKLIAQKQWPLAMIDGELTFQHDNINPDICYSLLLETVRYAAGIVGRRIVMREMRTVDEQMDEQSRRIAEEAGLSTLFDNTR